MIAGILGSLLGLQHAYWAMSAAVLILHQGLDRRRTVQRGLERLAGTWLGLGLAAAVLCTRPHALVLVAAIMILNFLIELTVIRNYTVAAMFITTIALLIATGSQHHAHIASLLLARRLDTAGCAVALAVFLLMIPADVTTWLPTAIADVLDAINATTAYLSRATVATPPARTARRDLQRCTLALTQTFDNAVNGSTAQRRSAEHRWPAAAATQRLAYHVLAESWRLEHPHGHADIDVQSPPGSGAAHESLAAIATAVRTGHKPPPVSETSGVLADDLRNLRDALDREPT